MHFRSQLVPHRAPFVRSQAPLAAVFGLKVLLFGGVACGPAAPSPSTNVVPSLSAIPATAGTTAMVPAARAGTGGSLAPTAAGASAVVPVGQAGSSAIPVAGTGGAGGMTASGGLAAPPTFTALYNTV